MGDCDLAEGQLGNGLCKAMDSSCKHAGASMGREAVRGGYTNLFKGLFRLIVRVALP